MQRSAAPLLRRQNVGWYRFNIGALECTTVWDGYIHHSYDGIYPNAKPREIARLQSRFQLPTDHIPMDLNPVVVNTGDKLFLIDAGMGQTSVMFGDTMGRMLNNLAASGIDPRDIDGMLMTHLHPDHSYGLIYPDGTPVYSSATLYTTREEWQEWNDAANLIG